MEEQILVKNDDAEMIELPRSFSAAAGKSTFVRLLEEQSGDWEVVPEPIARWCNVQTKQSEFEVRYFTYLFYLRALNSGRGRPV